MLRRRTNTPSTVAGDSGTIDRDKGKNPGRPSLKIPDARRTARTGNSLREFTGNSLGVSRWTVNR